MTKLTARAVRVYAVLEAYRPGQGDILDTILPFFEPFLADDNGQVLNPDAFAKKVREAYGWNITRDVIEELIPRFLSKGWLRDVGSKTSKAYRIEHVGNVDFPLDDTEMKIAQAISELAGQFKDFITQIAPLSGFVKSKDELAEVLIEWLISIDGYTQDAVKAQAVKISDIGGRLTMEVPVIESGKLSSEDRYLAARFVKHLFNIKSNYTGQLSRIASIALLTDVVQDFSKPTSSVKKTDLVIYLDAPVAMDYLGLSGKASQENIEGILAPLKEIGSKVRIFRLSVDELERALYAVLSRSSADRVGPTADAMRRQEVLEAYVRAVKDDPDRVLRAKDVDIVERTVKQYPNSFAHFSSEQHDALFGRINWHVEMKPREHDATVVTLIMRMREGRTSRDVFKTRHILVTRNATFVERSRRFCMDEGVLPQRSVGPAIHQRQLATAAWLRTGLHQNLELPRRVLLAACERVLGVRKNVIEQAKAAAKNLKPAQAEQLDLLLTQDRSTQLLMDRTLGISTVITGENIEALVEDMKSQLVAEKDEEKRLAIEEEKNLAREKRGRDRQALDQAKEREQQLVTKIYQFDQTNRKIIERAVIEANARIRIRRRLVSVGVMIAVVALGGLPFLTDRLDGEYRISALVFSGSMAAATGYLQLWDRPVGIRHKLDRWAIRIGEAVLRERGIEGTLADLDISVSDGMLVCIARYKEPTRDTLF